MKLDPDPRKNSKIPVRSESVATSGSQWGSATVRISALALCFSAAEYAYPVWTRSAHARHVDSVLNNSCRIITGCLEPAKTNCLYILRGITSPDICWELASGMERHKAEHNSNYMLYGTKPAKERLNSRNCFVSSTSTIDIAMEGTRLHFWKKQQQCSPPGKTLYWTSEIPGTRTTSPLGKVGMPQQTSN